MLRVRISDVNSDAYLLREDRDAKSSHLLRMKDCEFSISKSTLLDTEDFRVTDGNENLGKCLVGVTFSALEGDENKLTSSRLN